MGDGTGATIDLPDVCNLTGTSLEMIANVWETTNLMALNYSKGIKKTNLEIMYDVGNWTPLSFWDCPGNAEPPHDFWE